MSSLNNTHFFDKYRGEILIALGSSFLGVVLGKLADAFLGAPLLEQISFGLLGAVAAFVGLLSVTIKKNISWPLGDVKRDLYRVLGERPPTIFDERRDHFPAEKLALVDALVRDFLPSLISEALENRAGRDPKIDILIDSGTTLETVLPMLKRFGFGRTKESLVSSIQIHTNNLSGVDHFSKEPSEQIGEDQVHLFGGIPMLKYRAVAGHETIEQIAKVAAKNEEEGGLIIGIVTANWILVGENYDRLILCSCEPQHLSYKRSLAELSDLLVVVSPLGKLLRVENVEALNVLLKKDGPLYERIELGKGGGKERTRENTFLMTSWRKRTESILHRHSKQLRRMGSRKDRSFTLVGGADGLKQLKFDPLGDRHRQLGIEMPHGYLHDCKDDVLSIDE